ncbi:hypothetical protein ACS4RR_001620 [Rhizobium sp. Z1P35]
MDIDRLLAFDIIWVGSPRSESGNVSALPALKVGQPGGSAANPSQEAEPPRHGTLVERHAEMHIVFERHMPRLFA